MVDLVKTRKKWVPEAAVKLATKQIRKSIKKKAQFDIKVDCVATLVVEHVFCRIFYCNSMVSKALRQFYAVAR